LPRLFPHLARQEAAVAFGQRLQEIREGFRPAFWVANLTELFERLAYYAVFAVLAIYFTESLQFSETEAGDLIGFFSALVWFLPILGGTLADRFGFRRSLAFAYLALGVGYFLLGSLDAAWLEPVRQAVPLSWLVLVFLAIPAFGPAIVKPCVVGTTARASAESVRSLGYSIYYTLVNIGGTLGPVMAFAVRRSLGIENVFRVSAACMLVMCVATLLFYREPRSEGEPQVASVRQAMANLFRVLANFRFLLFLVIFSGFWVMFWQEFIALVLFIRTYVNPRADVELLLTIDPLAVILFQILVSFLMRKVRPFPAMTLGVLVASFAWVILAVGDMSWQIDGTYQLGPWRLELIGLPVWAGVALFVLAVGEMIQSPRFYEYVSRLAPPGQQGVYMGYAFLPIAIGSALAGVIGGRLVHYFGEVRGAPQQLWWVIFGVGMLTTALMVVYDKMVKPGTAQPAGTKS
jgi:dipeptide/tripeptide permease